MPANAITLDTPVEDVMRRFPATIAVFMRRRMHCIGCAIGPFHTVEDAASEYHAEPEALLGELREVARAGRAPPSPDPWTPLASKPAGT